MSLRSSFLLLLLLLRLEFSLVTFARFHQLAPLLKNSFHLAAESSYDTLLLVAGNILHCELLSSKIPACRKTFFNCKFKENVILNLLAVETGLWAAFSFVNGNLWKSFNISVSMFLEYMQSFIQIGFVVSEKMRQKYKMNFRI